MSDFDPYHKWLGIPPQEQPAHHYRLLAITDFEVDRDVISTAAERQTVFLRTLQAGEHAALVAELLNEVSQAHVTLLNVEQKAEYDEELRKQQAPEPEPAATSSPAIPPPTPVIGPESDPISIPVVETSPPLQSTPPQYFVSANNLDEDAENELELVPLEVNAISPSFASVVQKGNKRTGNLQNDLWKRPAVIGVSVVGIIGVLVLVISMMSSGDADPVASNTPPVVTSPFIPSPEPVPAQATANTLPPSLQQRLIAYYPFNGNANDESGNGHHGEVQGAVLDSDRHGNTDQAYRFDGKDDFILVSDHNDLNLGNADGKKMTISLWFKGPVKEKSIHFIRKTGKGGTDSRHKDYVLYNAVRKGIVWGTGPSSRHGGDDKNSTMLTGVIPTAGLWHHLVAKYNHNEGGGKEVFLDGALIHQGSIGKKTESNDQPLHIGPGPGSIDDIRIYNRALSAAEVKSLYEYESKPPAKTVKAPMPQFGARPPPAIAPFDTDQAQAHQAAWAKHLGTQVEDTNSIGMKLSLIPAGTFMMGSPEDETARGSDEHQHQVTITKPFYMQTTEVTQGQWNAVMGSEPWKGEDHVDEGPNYAASYLSWDDAVAYCKKLSEKEGKTYRLPTGAEWEYACRAGTETRWSFGNDEKVLGDYAWYHKNADDIGAKYAHAVGLKKTNPYGLYDMHGNVWEWCYDYYEEDYYKQSQEKDPTGPASGSFHVLRGGSWYSVTRGTRSARRSRFGAVYRNVSFFIGFRLVRELDDSTQSTPPPGGHK